MPTHAEQKFLPYAPERLFDLVADIERYPEFLPWCVGARIRERHDNLILGDLLIGWRMVRERFTSRVHLHRPDRIDVEYAEGPFKYLENHWQFIPRNGGTLIDFHVDFEFRSHILSGIIDTVFTEAVKRMVAAFEKRARQLYGAP
ncbi:MAG: type II toxin-antitoxin system RatA family toxin [Alphaproteobacteria bacterium]|nr:type II toxin-antitoxin system RatA family toxin [Alphaproteobacteria bacterium]